METVKRRKIFRDVVRGYSTAIIDEDFVYIKHLTPHDQVELEEIEDKYYKAAQKRGVPSEAEMMDLLKKEGQWSDKDDEIIQEKEDFLERLKAAKSKMVIKSAIDKQAALIDKEEQQLFEKTKQKANLLGNTCEKYAKDRMNDFYMIKSFYKDKNLTEVLFDEQSYDELEDNDVRKYIELCEEILRQLLELCLLVKQVNYLREFFGLNIRIKKLL